MKDEVQRRRWTFDEGVSIEQGSIITAKEKRKKVLVVDDDQEMRNMLRSFLTYRGYYVKTVQDGIKGLAELEKDFYDLLITDIYMPGMSGLELLENIDKRNLDLSILAMTGMPSKKINETVAEKGAYGCLVKPFPLSLLLTTIEKCFE
jgi:DNA-binding NtrC family response regulator